MQNTPARHPQWEARLDAAINAARARPFAWGKHDCAHFALACLQAVSVREWRSLAVPRYSTAQGAARALKRLHCHHVADLATLLLGAPLPPHLMQRGDLATLPTAHGMALGVCLGTHIAAPAACGLSFTPLTHALACWRV